MTDTTPHGDAMTNQHSLTAEICFDIQRKNKVCYQDEVDLMRAAADWQLEQVTEWLKVNLMKHDVHKGFTYLYDDCSNAYIREEKLLEDLKEAMRPTTPKENNQ